MFYLIIGIMLILYYIFAAPSTIKGTLNLVALVFLLVALVVVLLLGVMKVIQSPPEIWVSLGMITLGLWTMRDLYFMPKKTKRKRN
ncbi:DUF3165 family protein [Streptococcus cameli]